MNQENDQTKDEQAKNLNEQALAEAREKLEADQEAEDLAKDDLAKALDEDIAKAEGDDLTQGGLAELTEDVMVDEVVRVPEGTQGPDGTVRNAEGKTIWAPPGSHNAAMGGVQQDASGHVDSAGSINSHLSGTRR